MTKSMAKRTTSKALNETAVEASLEDRVNNLKLENFANRKELRDAACQILREVLPWADEISINRKCRISITASTPASRAAFLELLGIPEGEIVFESGE